MTGRPMVQAIHPDATHTLLDWPHDPYDQGDVLRRAVGGSIAVIASGPTLMLWCNANGETERLAPNGPAAILASIITGQPERPILGTVVLTRRDGPDTLPLFWADPS